MTLSESDEIKAIPNGTLYFACVYRDLEGKIYTNSSQFPNEQPVDIDKITDMVHAAVDTVEMIKDQPPVAVAEDSTNH